MASCTVVSKLAMSPKQYKSAARPVEKWSDGVEEMIGEVEEIDNV